ARDHDLSEYLSEVGDSVHKSTAPAPFEPCVSRRGDFLEPLVEGNENIVVVPTQNVCNAIHHDPLRIALGHAPSPKLTACLGSDRTGDKRGGRPAVGTTMRPHDDETSHRTVPPSPSCGRGCYAVAPHVLDEALARPPPVHVAAHLCACLLASCGSVPHGE